MTVNDPGRAIYGWAPDIPLTFASAQAQFHPDDRNRVVRIVRAAFEQSGSEAFDVEHRIVRTDGTVRWIRVRGRALFEHVEGQRRPTRCLGTFVDITDRKEADERRDQVLRTERAGREEAERLGRLKDEFLATVSHELRTPLNAILGWSQLLRRRSMAPEETRSAIEVIDRNARAQAQLIDDLLDMSRFASGNIRVDMHHVDLAMVVSTPWNRYPAQRRRQAHSAASAAEDRRGHRLWRRRAAAAGGLESAQQRTEVHTGRRAHRRPARARGLADRSHDPRHRNGDPAGVSALHLPPFRQQDASTTRRHGGVGLGLSIVKQLVEVHAGDVRATSGGHGQGATFVVSLPVSHGWDERHPSDHDAAAAYHPATFPSSAAAAKTLEGVRVMAVEDEPDALVLLERVLQDAGAHVSPSRRRRAPWSVSGANPWTYSSATSACPGWTVTS